MYVRYYVRHAQALPTGHVAFTTLTDAADGGRHLRLGGQMTPRWKRPAERGEPFRTPHRDHLPVIYYLSQ